MTTFRLATEDDDALLRSILRENAMPTWVDMAIEREPSFFAGKNVFGEDWAVIAEEDGEVVGMYTASALPLFIDGAPARVGYLGGLRVRDRFRRRIRHLREGYASILRLAPAEVQSWFTVIAAENDAARRLLERGVRGLPRYELAGEYTTYAIATSRGRRRGLWREATPEDMPAVVAFYNEYAKRFDYAPVLDSFWTAAAASCRFFFLPAESGSSTLPQSKAAVAALWDQRAFKQIVARRYRKPIGALLPLYNAFARLTHRIPLPSEGRALDQTFIAFATSMDQAQLEDLLTHCTTPAASIGLHVHNPLVEIVKRMKPIAYPARIYSVTLSGAAPHTNRPVQPEAALL